MTMPNFLIIGAAKAGTTALYWYLDQHPEVFMSPEKEPRFFSYVGREWDTTNPALDRTINTLEKYEALFEGVTDEKAIGEASPSYLFNRNAPAAIKEYLPDVKMIVILRHPAERAFSHFLHFIKCGYETNYDFEQAVNGINDLKIGNWIPREDYISFGYYAQQLKRYYELFDKEQIKVYLHEELRRDTDGVLRDIYRFIGVDESFQANTARQHNVSGIPKSRFLQNLVGGKGAVKKMLAPLKAVLPKETRDKLRDKVAHMNLEKPVLPDAARAELIELYRDDILQLQDLIDRDLSDWLKV